MNTNAILRQIPKAELHCHLDGALRPATIFELAKEAKIPLPADTVEDLLPLVQTPPTCGSLAEFLKAFDIICPILRRPQALERAAYELLEDCADDNIRHVETRVAPELLSSSSMSSEEAIFAILQGLKKGRHDFGVSASVIICLFRAHGRTENDRAFAVLKKAFRADASLDNPAVVAMDLAGDEARHPTKDFADYFAQARALKIPTTCHAGETRGTENLKSALEFKVDRIGHGVHLMEDRALLAEVVRRKIPLEIGITSNVRTKAVADSFSHPARSFYQAGAIVTFNTDDRGVFGIDLTHEYAQAMNIGFSLAELFQISERSVRHLFLPQTAKRTLAARFATELSHLLEEANETA
ncbi:MAG: adenosine deaminase [Elusimicrobiota bacterium]